MDSAYLEVLRGLVFRAIQTETRLSERQIAQLRWSQIQGAEIVTVYKRRAKISGEVVAALSLLPHSHSFVFFGTSLAHRQDSEAMRELRRQFAEEDARKRGSTKHFLFNRGLSMLTK